MHDVSGRVRRLRTVFASILILLAGCRCAAALNPSLEISQYAHTAWKVRDGFVDGSITAIAQTPDGYLWIGTEFDLFRFDGVRAVPWRAISTRPIGGVRQLLATPDGTLWIGGGPGLLRWKDGKVSEYPQLANRWIGRLLADRDGRLWVASQFPLPAQLCVLDADVAKCDEPGGQYVASLFVDAKGSVWAGLDAAVERVSPGPRRVFPLASQQNGYQALGEEDDALMLSLPEGLARFVDGKIELAYPSPQPLRGFTATALLRDRDGGLWMGTSGRGLAHVHQGRTDLFTSVDGLSGDFVYGLLEDREGSVWVATSTGLDRFRNVLAPTYGTAQGLSNGSITAVLAARDGSVWIGTADGLNRWDRGHVTTYREQHHSTPIGVREIVGRGWPDRGSHAMMQDSHGRIWISDRRGAGYVDGDRLVTIPGVPGTNISSIVEDTHGDVWIAATAGLAQLRHDIVVKDIPWSALSTRGTAFPVVADPVRGGLWMGFLDRGVAYVADGSVKEMYSAADGLGGGFVNRLRVDGDGTVWASTNGGLSRLKEGRIDTLNATNGLPCDHVQWAIDDDVGGMWIGLECGLARASHADIDAWTAGRPIRLTTFDRSENSLARARRSTYNPQATKSADGRIWFSTSDGVAVIDPTQLPVNTLEPSVRIEQVAADRHSYRAASGLRLPRLTRDLQIDYTALSLAASDENRFRVKLEGRDRDWQDVGTRRQAFYSDLPPGEYRFRVTGSNNSGVWNEAGASLDFAIAPAYYQTTWFQAMVALTGLALLWAAYQVRVRRIAREFDLQMEARVDERTRVARELHDTLLQTCHGVLFRFQAAVNMLPERPAEAKQEFESAIDRAAQAMTEARDAIQDLRASTIVTNDLAVAISTLGDELGASGVNGHGTVARVVVQGTPRDLHPILRDDIYRIAGEALRNSFRHAHARRIEVEITYDDRQFRLQVRDDGKGMDAPVLADDQRGHFGLPGMRERAELVGGRLDVWSEVASGTEVELTIPGSVAYARVGRRRSVVRMGRGGAMDL